MRNDTRWAEGLGLRPTQRSDTGKPQGAELRKMEAQGAMAIEGLHLLAVGLEMGSSFGR